MRKDLTDITVVLDRSGSMSSVKSDAEGGLNGLIADQKAAPGEALFTLVQFDSEYEFVHRAVPIKEVGPVELHPRGNTALLDAVGRAITETGERLAAMAEADRPGLVVFVIITDGCENASREFSLSAVRRMIKEQQEVYKWVFNFLGANADAFAGGSEMGFSGDTSAQYREAKTAGAIKMSSQKLAGARDAVLRSATPDFSYTDAERKELE